MAMTREEVTGALGALSLITGAATKFKAIDVKERMDAIRRKEAIEEREDRQAHEFSVIDDRQAHDTSMQEDRQAFQKEENLSNYKRQIKAQYPGVSFDVSGSVDFTGYDFTNSVAAKAGNAAATMQQLREFGLSTDGDSKVQSKRLAAYYQGRNKSATMMTASVDLGVSNLMGGDISPTTFTQRDLADYREWIDGNGGYNNPIVLESLVSSGIIPEDVLDLDTITGLYSADAVGKDLIDVALQGFESGALQNKNFQTNMQWEAVQENKRLQNLQFAEVMAGSPGVIQSSNVFKSTSRAIGARLKNQITPDGEAVMMWQGRAAEISDIKNFIDKSKASFSSSGAKENFKSMIDQISSIQADGSGLENILEQINQGPKDPYNIPLFLRQLSKFDQGLAKTLTTALNQYNKITKVANLTNRFISTPKQVEDISDFRQFLQSSGIINKIQEYRTAEVLGENIGDLQSEIENAYEKIITALYNSGDVNMLNEFKAWVELEEATSDLRKINIRGR